MGVHFFDTRDRMPFLTTVADGSTKSFVAKQNDITKNLIVANYGASQVPIICVRFAVLTPLSRFPQFLNSD